MNSASFAAKRACQTATSLAAFLALFSLGSVRALADSGFDHGAGYQQRDSGDHSTNPSPGNQGSDRNGQSASDWNSRDSSRSGQSARAEGGAPVPEPSSWILMGTLVLGVTALAFREKNRVRV
jgi:hypothetical protein